jgi:hypothetical protein
MKKLYPIFLSYSFFTLLFFIAQTSLAQCPNGQPSGGTAFDTTIRFSSGVTHRQVKFPKFNPQAGMLSCVRLVITMTGIIDTSAFENLTDAPITVTRSYNRTDNMAGPGLTPSLQNSFNGITNIPLSGNNGVDNSGPDFYANSKDTVMSRQMVRTLTDSTAISAFYGTDSVVYDYDINVISNVTAGGDIAYHMRTSAFVNFRFEYCTCPLATLPVGLKNFMVAKAGANATDLRWEAEAGTDNYFYEIEVSRDGQHFSKVGVQQKTSHNAKSAYQYTYPVKANEYGRYYFRVKQRWLDGYYRSTEIKSVDFINPLFSTVSIYPNPSSGNVGMKFVAAKAGNYAVEVSNAVGQIVARKNLQVAATDYKHIATLQKGTYYVKITEQSTQSFFINQLVVQ